MSLPTWIWVPGFLDQLFSSPYTLLPLPQAFWVSALVWVRVRSKKDGG